MWLLLTMFVFFYLENLFTGPSSCGAAKDYGMVVAAAVVAGIITIAAMLFSNKVLKE